MMERSPRAPVLRSIAFLGRFGPEAEVKARRTEFAIRESKRRDFRNAPPAQPSARLLRLRRGLSPMAIS